MTVVWERTAPLSPAGARRTERWTRTDGGDVATVDVGVQVGKPLDVVALKRIDPDGHRDYTRGLAAAAAGLYAGHRPQRPACPACTAPAAGAGTAATVFGVRYARCGSCGHVFVAAPPDPAAVAERFAASQDLSAAYTDPAAVEARLAQIVVPKLDWALDRAREACGREPRTVVDVGAGGGHFVAAARRAGLDATGFELSRASCRFARDVLGVDLVNADALTAPPAPGGADIVTLWGVLEYAPEPLDLLRAARRHLAPGGLVVVEVPRADALSTAVQAALPEGVARHLDPTSHLQTFSDASLATALWDTGLRPVAAWYFGMDAYELLSQVALRDAVVAGDLATALLALQPALDGALLCDDVVVAAVERP